MADADQDEGHVFVVVGHRNCDRSCWGCLHRIVQYEPSSGRQQHQTRVGVINDVDRDRNHDDCRKRDRLLRLLVRITMHRTIIIASILSAFAVAAIAATNARWRFAL